MSIAERVPVRQSAGSLIASSPYAIALEGTLREMPYNSATEYHRAHGGAEPPASLGSACILQSLEAAQRAHELGAPAPTMLCDDRHVAAVFDDADAGIVVLDPYLLHLEPVVFPRHEVDAGASTVEVAAAPIRFSADGTARPGKLRARFRRKGAGFVIRLSTTKYSPRTGQYTVARHFTLRSDSLFDRVRFEANLRGLLTHPEQTSVSIRAVDPATGRTAESIIPLRGYARRDFSAADIWLRDGQGATSKNGSAGSDAVWGSLESLVGVGRQEIVDHLVGAARIYQSIADPHGDVAVYSTESE